MVYEFTSRAVAHLFKAPSLKAELQQLETYTGATDPTANFSFSASWLRGFLKFHGFSIRRITTDTRNGDCPMMEAELIKWIQHTRKCGIPVETYMMRVEAKALFELASQLRPLVSKVMRMFYMAVRTPTRR